MRWLVIAIVTCVARGATAGRYDVGWAGIGMSLGASPQLSGAIADRLAREPCESTCPLGMRMALGAGVGRWGGDLQLASSPVIDVGATDYRDRDRRAFRVGMVGRFTLMRRFGFDLSLRGGVQYGSLAASSTTTQHESCTGDRVCDTIEMTYTPPSYSLWAFPLGATLRLGVREPGGRGYFALFADYDYSIVHVAFDDGGRFGAMQSMTYGFWFGTMFDLR